MEAETPPTTTLDTTDPNDSLDSTIHGFNSANITVLERSGAPPGDGSDSGVELPPCDATSCCAVFEDAFARLARRNSTLLQDLKDGSGSESSSTSSRPAKRLTSSKKKVAVSEPTKSVTPSNRSRPSMTPRSTALADRSKSKERQKPTPRPSTLKTCSTPRPKPVEPKPRASSSSRAARTPAGTPTADDGRWPSTSSTSRHSVMTRSFRGGSAAPDPASVKARVSNLAHDSKNTLEKYATLPRRRRERSADNVRENSVTRADKLQTCTATLRRQASRESTPSRSLPPCPKKKPSAPRTRIYCEASVQTTLCAADVERLCMGGEVAGRGGGERTEAEVQTEQRDDPAVLELRAEVRRLKDEVAAERREKQALKEELDSNMLRVQTILGNTHTNQDSGDDNDSLLELESRFEAAGQVIIKQENEISELHAFCRTLQRELECREAEGQELQEFLAAEKATLSEALGEAEGELRCVVRAAEQRRQEALTLAARLAGLEARSRDLLLAHGAAVSGAAVALASLAQRLDTLAVDLTATYHLDTETLDDAVYHNEVYSPDTPDTPASFLASVMSAIRSAVTDTSDEPSEHSDMLDSETEPCLMMDAVLEDVVAPDTHSVNLVSVHSGGDSLNSLAQAILQRQRSEQCPATLTLPDTNASALVDQVIEADNLLTRLLRVVRSVHGALAQQLRDWEALGGRLKTELAAKASEADELRSQLGAARHQAERLTQDVCALSTACSEAGGAERQLAEARALLQQHWRDHYRQLDQALETLHECDAAVAASPALAQLQRDLEAASFACAAAPLCVPALPSPTAPADLNANAATSAPATLINSTA